MLGFFLVYYEGGGPAVVRPLFSCFNLLLQILCAQISLIYLVLQVCVSWYLLKLSHLPLYFYLLVFEFEGFIEVKVIKNGRKSL